MLWWYSEPLEIWQIHSLASSLHPSSMLLIPGGSANNFAVASKGSGIDPRGNRGKDDWERWIDMAHLHVLFLAYWLWLWKMSERQVLFCLTYRSGKQRTAVKTFRIEICTSSKCLRAVCHISFKRAEINVLDVYKVALVNYIHPYIDNTTRVAISLI